MTSKSEFKVGDLVRRLISGGAYDARAVYAGPKGTFLDAGIVIAIDRRHRLDDNVACVKWMDTTRGQGHWYFNQLQRVIKE